MNKIPSMDDVTFNRLQNSIVSPLIEPLYFDYEPILNNITGAVTAYSLRKLKSGAQYTIRVRRSTDDAELDIGFTGINLDKATLLSFVGSGSGYVKVWYDQSGYRNDAIQTTTENQPRIVDSGTLSVDTNSKSTLYFDGTNSKLNYPSMSLFQNVSGAFINAVAKDTNRTAGNQTHAIFGASNGLNSSNGRTTLATRQSNINDFRAGGRRLDADAFAVSNSSPNNDNFNILSGNYDYAGQGKVTLYVNSTPKTAANFASVGNTSNTASLDIGIGDYGGLSHLSGNISEIIVFTKILTDIERKKIEKNQSKYFNIAVT